MTVTGTFSTTVCVVGGGPAGAMLGLLLARVGVDVTVLEKHADFLRDFRGDTVHPATLEVLDELGLAERFHELPHRKISSIGVIQDGVRREMANFGHLEIRFPYIAMIPQWEFLNFITTEASRYPNFRLLMRSEFRAVHREGGRIRGIRYRGPDGDHTIHAGLTVAADGRDSAVRDAAGLRPRKFGAPIDVVLFRITRHDSDPDDGISVRIGDGTILGLIDRGTYWQAFFEIPKGAGIVALREAGIDAFRRNVVRLAPFLADRVAEITSIEATSFLDVRIDRLRRWHVPGVLVIGDAAHCMSPVGGLGVNLAVQDAVATANLLDGPLMRYQRTGTPLGRASLAAVQRRRSFPTVAIQQLQRLSHRVGLESAPPVKPGRSTRFGVPQKLLGRLIGVGFRPEHVRLSAATTSGPAEG